MALGQVSSGMVYEIQMKLQDALAQLDKLQGGFDKTSTSAQNMYKNLKTQLKSTGATFDVFGKHSEGVSQKFEMVKDSMKQLNLSTQDGQRQFNILSRYGKALQSTMKNTKVEVSSLAEGLKNIAGKGFAQLDKISGGAAGEVANMGKMLGMTAKGAGIAAIAIGAVVVAWKGALEPGIKFNMMLEQQSMAFEVMLGSAENAKLMIGELKTLSLNTPIGLEEGATGTKQLLAYGFGQKEIISNLKMMSTVAKAVNVPLQDMVYVYGTLRAQGRAYTRDLMQFAMRGVPIYEYLGKIMNANAGDIRKMAEEGKIGFKEVEAAMQAMTGEGGKFFNLLEKSMTTATGKVTVLGNSWKMLTGEMAQSSMPAVKAILDSLIRIVKHSSFWKYLVMAIGTVLTGIGATVMWILEGLNGVLYIVTSIVEGIVKLGIEIGQWVVDLFRAKDAMGNSINGSAVLAQNMKAAADQAERARVEFEKMKGISPSAKSSVVDYGVSAVDSRKSDPYAQYTSGLRYLKDAAIEAEKNLTALQQSMVRNTYLMQDMPEGTEQFPEKVKQAIEKAKIYYIALAASASKASEDMSQTWEFTARQMAQSGKFSAEALEMLLSYGEKYKGFFEVYQNVVESSFSKVNYIIKSGVDAANKVLDTEMGRSAKKGAFNFIDTAYSDNIALGAEEKIKWLESYIGKIQTTIDALSFNTVFQSGEGLAFYKGLINELANAKEEMSGLGAVTKETSNDIQKAFLDISRYMEDRVVWMNKENGELLSFLQNRGLITDSLSEEARIADSVKFAYQQQRDALREKYLALQIPTDTQEAEELYREYQIMLKILDIGEKITKEDKLRAKALADLEDKLDINSMLQASTGNLETQRKLIIATYDIEKERLATLYNGEENLAKLKAALGEEEYKLKQSLLDLDLQRYDIMLNGDQKHFDMLRQTIAQERSKGANANAGAMIGATTGLALEGTELGSIMAGGDPVMMLVNALLEMMTAVENVKKVLFPFSTALEVALRIVEGPLNDAFEPLVESLEILGDLIGIVLLPFIAYTGMLNALLEPLIDLLKEFIVDLKKWLNIQSSDQLKALEDARNKILEEQLAIERKRLDSLRDIYDKQADKLWDLVNLGAISVQEYEERLKPLNDKMDRDQSLFDLLETTTEQRKKEPMKRERNVFEQIGDGVVGFFNGIGTAIGDFFGFADGTSNIPSNMLANVHKGEMIIPKTFAESLRNGDMALSGGRGMGGEGAQVININVQGSVIEERNLVQNISYEMNKLSKQGYITTRRV